MSFNQYDLLSYVMDFSETLNMIYKIYLDDNNHRFLFIDNRQNTCA